jgi:hypothetical protein
MIRRRRPVREIAFSFDSFLDVVANVVGIILRLILVAWVGARAYKGALPPPPPPPPSFAAPAPLPEITDPLTETLARERQELARIQAELLERLREWQQARAGGGEVGQELAALAEKQKALQTEQAALAEVVAGKAQAEKAVSLSREELLERLRKLAAEIDALKKAPSLKRDLRYHVPVSRPLQTEELMFECRGGRVTLIDIGTLVEMAQRRVRDKEKALANSWEVEDSTPAVGAFRLRYTVGRERGVLDGIGGLPDPRSNFRYGLNGWEVQPVQEERGETADAALASGSAFRRVADGIDPAQTAVTLWVYPDSFPLYRRLRDYLHQRDAVVAGRPLPDGVPIASRPQGTASRGQ